MRYLYYRFYRAALFLRKSGDPDIRAWLVFSITQGMNIYSLKQIYFSLITHEENLLPDYVIILTGLAICLINYLLFLYKDRYKRILEKYSKESKSERIRGAIIGYIYVFGSIALVFYAKHLQFS